MIDRLRLAELAGAAKLAGTRLAVRSPAAPFVCVINGCQQEAYTYRVSLPERTGPACLPCATDAGFEVR